MEWYVSSLEREKTSPKRFSTEHAKALMLSANLKIIRVPFLKNFATTKAVQKKPGDTRIVR
jgi:hypothetical protein